MQLKMVPPILLICISFSFAVYALLQTKYPSRGSKLIGNALKETISFDEALNALSEGNRIRRKSERKGYTKMIISEGKRTKEQFGSYTVNNEEEISNYCFFSIEDVYAKDWIIDN